ncbi:hypothetical protein U1Q18_019598 [Sarracenia purpurea var. burkii]
MRVLPSSGSTIECRSSLAIRMRSGPKPTDLIVESSSIDRHKGGWSFVEESIDDSSTMPRRLKLESGVNLTFDLKLENSRRVRSELANGVNSGLVDLEHSRMENAVVGDIGTVSSDIWEEHGAQRSIESTTKTKPISSMCPNGGLDILRWHFKNVSHDVKDSLALDLVNWLRSRRRGSELRQGPCLRFGQDFLDFRRSDNYFMGTRFLELDQSRTHSTLVPTTTLSPAAQDHQVQPQEPREFRGAARPAAPENIRSCDSTVRRRGQRRMPVSDCSSGGCDRAKTIIELFMESEFCLQPPATVRRENRCSTLSSPLHSSAV